MTYPQPTTNNVDTRDPIGSKKLEIFPNGGPSRHIPNQKNLYRVDQKKGDLKNNSFSSDQDVLTF